MSFWVADASVACKWHFEEEDTSLAKTLLRGEGEILAPDSFLSEFANAAGRKIREGEVSREHAEQEGAMLVTSDHAFLRKTADSRWRKHIIALRDFAARQKE